MRSPHPEVERVVHEKIGEARANDSPYAKGNLRRLAIDDLWSARSTRCRQLIRLELESSVG